MLEEDQPFYSCRHGQLFRYERPGSENNTLSNGNQCSLVADLLKKPLISSTQAFGNMTGNFIDFGPTPALKLIGNEPEAKKVPSAPAIKVR